jgi:hypothetical protein
MLLSPWKTWRLIETARASCYWPPEKLRSPENKFHLTCWPLRRRYGDIQ